MIGKDHDGACGFCGTAVRQGFNTCSSCGADYRRVMSTGQAALVICLVAIFGLLLAAAIAVPLAGVLLAATGLLAHWAGAPENALRGSDEVFYIATFLISYATFCIVATRRSLRARKMFMWFRVQN